MAANGCIGQPDCSDSGTIEVKSGEGGTSSGRQPNDFIGILRPNEMLLPRHLPGVKESTGFVRNRIVACCMARFVPIAVKAGQGQIITVI